LEKEPCKLAEAAAVAQSIMGFDQVYEDSSSSEACFVHAQKASL
jgi:hypothetical protein